MSVDECSGCRELRDRLAVLEAAPSLASYMKSNRLVASVKSSFAQLAELIAMAPEQRALAIRSTNTAAVKSVMSLSAHHERLKLVDGLDDVSRILAMRWLDRSAAIAVAVDTMDDAQKPELTHLTNVRDHSIEYSAHDAKGHFVIGRTIAAKDSVLIMSSQLERELGACIELGEYLERGWLVERAANAHEVRTWMMAATSEGEKYMMSPAFLVIAVGDEREMETSSSLDASTKRSVAAVRAADTERLRAAATQNHSAAANANASRSAKHR